MADHGVCPWWMGYLLLIPIRRFGQSPNKILGPLIAPGMTTLDVGCAMGYFSIPMARMVGPAGRVICVDLEPRMLTRLQRRAEKAGVADRIEARLCGADSIPVDDVTAQVDVALAFAVVHEVPDAASLFAQLHQALRPSGVLLFAEPKGHIRAEEYARSLEIAGENGFRVTEHPRIARSHAALLGKK